MSLNKKQQQMIDDIESEVAFTRRMTGRDHLSAEVMEAMREVPRDAFVPSAMKHAAFCNGPLPIGHGQTISQPYIVALMTDMLQLKPADRVLEIGTGSGYQTAILSRLVRDVFSVEVVPELSSKAGEIFRKLGYENIHIRVGNGYEGWPEHAPYDAIIVTAAASHIPPALVDQLKPGGNLVIPVGEPYSYQRLVLVTKDRHGEVHSQDILGVAFVPLVDTGPPAE